MDYRLLLRKYIAHVGSCEGVTFLSDWSRTDADEPNRVHFTDAEWATLRWLDERGWPDQPA